MKKLKCYDIQDCYKKILKKDRIVDEKTFGTIIKTYFKNTIDILFDFSQVYFPYGMGMLRYQIVDMTPYYDTKTGTVVGGVKHPACVKSSYVKSNKIIKISYYKCDLKHNPFRFCRFKRSRYLSKMIGNLYKTGNLNSLFTKKI